MSGFMKTVLISTQPPWNVSKKIHRLFHSINDRQSLTTATNPPCLWLAGRLLAPKAAGNGWRKLAPAKKMTSAKNTTLGDLPHPPGVIPWGSRLESTGCLVPGLSAPYLLHGSPPGLACKQAPCWLSPADRRETFAPNLTRFS